jgi:hypothetical protein
LTATAQKTGGCRESRGWFLAKTHAKWQGIQSENQEDRSKPQIYHDQVLLLLLFVGERILMDGSVICDLCLRIHRSLKPSFWLPPEVSIFFVRLPRGNDDLESFRSEFCTTYVICLTAPAGCCEKAR